MKNKTINKSCTLTAIKGVKTTPEMLGKINKYTATPLKDEGVFIRKYLLCHNGIDRDIQRFSEALLDDFARTLPGKSFLKVHNTGSLPIGLFFDAAPQEMTPEEFKTLNGEDIKLPADISMAKVVMCWLYILKEDFNEELMKQIDGGIYRHISIGFSASKLIDVLDTDGNVIFEEFQAPGSSREASIVYLGAQPGATLIKKPNESVEAGFKPDSDKTHNHDPEGGKEMAEELKKILANMSKSLDRNVTEGNYLDVINEMQTEIKSLADIKATLGEKQKQIGDLEKTLKERDIKIKDLTPLAEEGKVYRDNLVDEYILNKGKLEEVKETTDAHKALKDIVRTYPIDHLKAESKILQGRVNDKFPDKAQLGDTTESDEKGKGKGGVDDISPDKD